MSYHETRGAQCIVPKPVVEVLEEPKRVTFLVKGKKVELRPEKD
jgi:hypothetical protein